VKEKKLKSKQKFEDNMASKGKKVMWIVRFKKQLPILKPMQHGNFTHALEKFHEITILAPKMK